MSITVTRGTLASTLDELVDLAENAAWSPALTVYRWWEPHMQTPCLWHEITGESRAERRDQCSVLDTVRLDVVIVGPPRPQHGEDLLDAETYCDIARPLYDLALAGRPCLGGAAERGRRIGLRTGTERLGDEAHVTFVLPLEITLLTTT